ncbi:MAG TPA: lamin tail domain-containing protein [Candidatus Saccharimonadales bacterium]|nr:lamin tail domain-containing protein [Candidatus Saccharimonadales bacterium]
MKKRYILLAILIACSWAPAVHAEEPATQSIVIAAVQTGQEGAVGNDYAVIYNNGTQAADVTGWRLQYRAAGSTGNTGWTTKRTIACVDQQPGCTVVLPVGASLVFGTYSPAGVVVQPMASGFSDTGGQMRLVRPLSGSQVAVLDMVGYGTAAESEGGAPAAVPPAGRAILRDSADGFLADTNNNSYDFSVGCYDPAVVGMPVLVSCDPAVPEEDEEEPQLPQPVTPVDPPATPDPIPVTYARIIVTELLPDPESPATDSADEYIEIHNPGAAPVDLAGYTLQAGTDFKDSYTFGSMLVAPGGYAAIYSAITHLGLTNGGSAVQLLDPTGAPIDAVASYGQAKSGKAWAKQDSGVWAWTSPTPGSQNVFTATQSPAVLAATAAVKKAAAAAATKKAAAKPKAVKAAATPTAKSNTKAQTVSNQTPQEQAGSQVPYLILGVVGLGVVAYAAYEYRQDIARFGRKLKATASRRRSAAEPTLQTD